MTLILMLIKIISFTLFCLVSGFVLLCGKNGSDIKLMYAITSVLLLGVIIFH